MRLVDRDLIRGGHYGQRSCEPHQKAEHMAAPTNAAKREESSCQTGAVHTWHEADMGVPGLMSASLIGRLRSSAFRLSTTTVSMSLAGSCFSSESAPRPFQHGIRGRGGTIFWAALPSVERQVQADIRTHLIHRPARDIIPPLGGARVSSYRMSSCTVFMLLRPAPWSTGIRCRQPR